MANGSNRVNFEIGFSVDKSGLEQMQSLFQQIANKAKDTTKPVDDGLKRAAQTATTLDRILEKTFNTDLGSLNVTKFNQEMNKAGLTLKSVKADLAGAGNQGATAFNRLSQAILGTNMQLKQSSKMLNDMFVTFKNTIRYGISSSIFNNVTNAISRAYSYSRDLNSSLNDIRIVTDKSADSMEKFAVEANAAAKSLGASTLDYTNASLIYYQQGLSDEEAKARTETTLKAANITGQSSAAVSEQLTAVWNGYKVTAEETELYVDKLAAVAATTAADLEELSTGMSKVASAANAMGVDFDDLNAQIATIVSVTRQAPESVGTALKTIYARLGDLKVDGVDEFGVKLGEVSSQLQTMGIQILDQNGNMRDMTSVMTEVSEKQNTQTEAQRQAAAVAMAGKRQYNNLIALFDNWDMYSDALKTSTDAMGTLQHQQDIYMESTEAKLQQLKTTQQELYNDLIDTDELQSGINAITNLVKVFDNFVKSFGGGMKSIMGFAAIIVNIFNKQIAESINGAIQRQNVFKQNIELLQKKQETIALGKAESTGSSMLDQAATVNTEKQLEIAERIYEVRAGLNTEEYNNLTLMQQEVGKLAEQQKYIELQTTAKEKEAIGEERVVALLNEEYEKAISLNEATQDRYNTQQKTVQDQQKLLQNLDEQVQRAINLKSNTKAQSGYKSQILSKAEAIGKAEKRAVENILSQVDAGKINGDIKKAILEVCSKQLNKESDVLAEIEAQMEAEGRVLERREELAQLKEKELNIEQKINNAIEQGAKGKGITEKVVGITSALGTMAMAQSSVNSLIETQNDESASVGDKLTQTFMTLGFTLPMVISSFRKLGETFGATSSILDVIKAKRIADAAATSAQTAAQTAQNAVSQFTTITQKQELANLFALIPQEELEAAAIGKKTAAEVANIAVVKAGNRVSEEQLAAIIAHIEFLKKDTEATYATKTANDALNTSLLASPVFQVVAGLAAVTAAIAAVIKINESYLEEQEELRQARIEEQKEYEKQREEKRQEIKDNQDLLKSQNELYESYKKGTASKDDLAKKTEELRGVLSEEDIAVVTLTGDYDLLNKKIIENRKLETEKKLQQNKNDIQENRQKIRDQLGDKKALFSEESYNNLMGSLSEEAKRLLSVKESEAAGFYDVEFKLDTDFDITAFNELIRVLKKNDRISDETLNSLINYQKNIYDTEQDNKLIKLESQYYDKEINSFEDYNNSLEEIINELIKNKYGKDATRENATTADLDTFLKQAIDILDTTHTETNDYRNRALATNSLVNKYGTTFGKGIDVKEFADSLSQEDLTMLLSGKVVIDKDTTETDIKNQLKAISESLDTDGELEIVTSLRAKLTSGKKLTKKELEEAMGEESTLAQDYTEFTDFENQSELEQIKNINAVGDAEIKKNEETLANAKDIAKEKLKYYNELAEEELKLIKKTEQNGGTALSAEEGARLQEIKDALKDFPVDTVEYLKKVSEEGFGFDEIDSTIFDNLISGIDGVISQANVLKDLAEDIGENQTIAADDIERFGKNFPEIVANAENYKFLQDGSLQLTKEGQAAYQDIINAQKEEIQVKYEAYRAEVEKNAQMHKASADYYEAQAQAIDDYLNGESNAADTVAKLNKNVADYKEGLVEAEVKDDANAKISMMDNLTTQTNDVLEKTQSQYEYQCAVGETIQAAAEAMTSGHFEPPAGPSGAVSSKSGSVSKEFYGSTKDVEEFQGMTTEQLEQLRDIYKQRAKEELNKQSTEESKLMGLDAAFNSANNAMDRAASGKGGKESKSSGGSKKDKDKDKKEQEDEFDRYQEIKKAIDAVDRAISKLEKDQENLFGYELIASLQQENQLLEQQAANYERLYEMQQQEAAELREQLGTMGVMFDASGAITNYAAATSAALQAYAAAIEQYNAGLIDETTLGVYEKSYENFKKLLERYDQLYYTEMQDTQDKLDDIWRKQLANNLKAWETEIQIHLDTEKAKREQNDFLKDIKQDFRKVFKDLTIDVKYDEKNFKSFVNDVGTTTKAIKDVEAEIDKMMGGGESSMFESVSQAQEKLKELQEQLIEQGKSLYELYKQVWEAYLEGMEQVKDQFDELIKRYEHFNNLLEFHRNLIELLYGDKAYDMMNHYYEAQEKNTLAQIDSMKQQVDYQNTEFEKSYQTALKAGSKVDLNDFTTQTEDMKKAYENMIESQESLNDLIVDAVELLQNKYLNTINQIMDTMDKGIQGKDGFDGMKEDQEFMQKMADEYLDSVEGAVKIQTFANKMDIDKANASSLKAQQKIQAFREKEIDILREKENLTQADIDLAEARYQLMLREIALEDAQNNKTSMKLTRNEQGNQSYQYVADEEDVGNKEQDLLSAYGDLYKLADDSYNHAMELAFDAYETYRDKVRELYEDTTLTEEERNQKILELQDQYFPMMEAAVSNSELYKQEAMQASAGVFQEICDQDETAYSKLNEEQQRLVDALRDKNFEDYDEMRTALIEEFYPDLNDISEEVFKDLNINSQTTAAQIIGDQAKNPDSVKNEINKAISSMQDALHNYQSDLDKLQEVAGIDFSKIGEYIDGVIGKIDSMDGATEQMANNASQYLDELRRVLNAVADDQNSVIRQIQDAQNELQNYLNMMRAARQEQTGGGGNTGGGSTTPPGGTGQNPGNGEEKPGNTKGSSERWGIRAQDGHHGVQTRADGTGDKGLSSVEEAHELYQRNQRMWSEAGLSQFAFQNLDKNAGFPAYKTGGYTGEQADDSGRLAMLHQKELVLNADDTENFLKGITMIRDMSSLNGSISNAIISAIGGMALSLGNVKAGIGPSMTSSSTSTDNNIFNITAEFPNANDVDDIREAILSLPNYVSQYVGRNVR